MNMNREIITPKEASQILKLKPETIRQLMRQGSIPACKVGGSWRTIKGAIYEYLENKMGLESRVRIQGREENPQRILQVQRRSKAVDKRRKGDTQEPGEIFFPR